MTREEEFEKIKELIKKHLGEAECGLFDTRNIAGDRMHNIFNGTYFDLDICYGWCYFEVFGTNAQEFNELKKYYNKLLKGE